MADAINPQVSVADPTGPFMPVEKASVVPYAPLLAFPVIMHFFHGNYCGRGKVDETYRKPATDVVDRLCMRHDRCYGRVEATPMTRRAKKAAFCGCDAALFRRATKKRANYRSVPINLRSKVIVLQRIFGAKSKSCRP
jgi:hypothetical protein